MFPERIANLSAPAYTGNCKNLPAVTVRLKSTGNVFSFEQVKQ